MRTVALAVGLVARGDTRGESAAIVDASAAALASTFAAPAHGTVVQDGSTFTYTPAASYNSAHTDDTNPNNPYDPTIQWDSFPVGTISDLGVYSCP